MTILKLVQVRTSDEWSVYHRIRKAELFDDTTEAYDEHHPAEFHEGNVPLLFLLDGNGIATTRLDFRLPYAIVRLVAVASSHQGLGYGRALAEYVEEWARMKHALRLDLNARSSAVGFYQRLGYFFNDWDPSDKGLSEDNVQMSKLL